MNLNAGGPDQCLLEDCGFQFQRGATEHYWAWWRFRLGGISKLRAAYFGLDRALACFPPQWPGLILAPSCLSLSQSLSLSKASVA